MNNLEIYEPIEKDLLNISRIKRVKPISESCTAMSIEFCIINGTDYIIKTHRGQKTYNNEKKTYILLQNENFLPKLVYFNDKNLKLCITDVGKSLPIIKNINLKDYEKQLVNIIDIMCDKYNLFHNDLRPKNICIDANNYIKLIDFDSTSNTSKEDKYVFKSNKHNFPLFYRSLSGNKVF